MFLVFVENHKNSHNSPYKFNAKERDAETGYYYYGARYYNPRVSLRLNVDPLAEKFPRRSPYEYTFSSPVRYTDPDGREPIDDFKLHKNGRLELIKRTNDSFDSKQIKNYFYFLAANTNKEWNYDKLSKDGMFGNTTLY